jgi:hypothetical protein
MTKMIEKRARHSPFQRKHEVNYISKLISSRAVNTLHLDYKKKTNQLMLYREMIPPDFKIYTKTHTNTNALFGYNLEL